MQRTKPIKRPIAVTQYGDAENKRLRVDNEAVTARSNGSVASSSFGIPVFSQPGIESGIDDENWVLTQAGGSKFSLASTQSPQHPHMKGESNGDSDSDSDTAVFTPSDFEASLPDTESEESAGPSSTVDNDDLNMVTSEAIYHELLSQIQQRMGYCFPEAMVAKLETNRLRASNQPALQSSSGNALSHRRKAYVIMHLWEAEYSSGEGRVRQYEVIGMALSREKANVEAMAYFYLKDPRYLCRSGVVTRKPHNDLGSLFMEVKEYSHASCLEKFCEKFGTKDCSAWGIDGAGCLGLLANHGLSGFETVYVEEEELFN
ncbi:hypothetical protein F5Y05DRAFT_388090 [Hypoxylon sp. FL0543]|nr:hypothetical protein F5Y05DRAFT_388090 [Hypoxylon sp. FL0543]